MTNRNAFPDELLKGCTRPGGLLGIAGPKKEPEIRPMERMVGA